MAGRNHVGLVDEEKAKKLAFFQKCEADKQKVVDWLKNEEQGLIIVDANNPVDVPEYQLGTPLNWHKFEKMLRKLPSGDNYVMEDLKDAPKARYLSFVSPKGRIKIGAYGKIDIPEYSTICVEEVVVRDFSLNMLKPVDMPKVRWNPEKGEHETVDGGLLPGWKKIYKTIGENPWDLKSRGYRTLLMRIVHNKLATPDEVEKVFGKSSRASWNSLHQDTGYKF